MVPVTGGHTYDVVHYDEPLLFIKIDFKPYRLSELCILTNLAVSSPSLPPAPGLTGWSAGSAGRRSRPIFQ